jgi:hypothetical protein
MNNYAKGAVFAICSVPVSAALLFAVARFIWGKPIPLWPDSFEAGGIFGFGLLLATLRFAPRFTRGPD